MICLHRLNPMPELDVLVVKKGTKILSRTSGKIPSPLSDTQLYTLMYQSQNVKVLITITCLRYKVTKSFVYLLATNI